MEVLLIEDDQRIAELVERGLTECIGGRFGLLMTFAIPTICASTFVYGQGTGAPAIAAISLRSPYYIGTKSLDLGVLLPDPPPVDSAANREELRQLHQLESTRTPQAIAQAQADDREEDMFVFQSVLGSWFSPEKLPITAALGGHVKNEQSAVGSVLKKSFERPRPFQVDSTLNPVCSTKDTHDSYPSGHALTGYLEALTLTELLPDRRIQLLARADEYAHNREVCGVHYPSDVEASRRAAYAIFGFMLATPNFQQDLAAAREEIRGKLSSTHAGR